jgi:hypothetical protein
MLGRIKNAKPEEEITVTAGTEAKEVLPSSGKTIKKATVNPTPSQTKSVTPSASQKIVTPDSGKLLNKVTVAGDSDLVAGNIKKDVNIFGVTGTFDGEEIVNGIIEEYCSYYNDISPNTFVEYLGELSYAYTNRQETQLYSSNENFYAPVAVQLNDNTVVIAVYKHSSYTSDTYLNYVALTFDMSSNTINVGSLLSTSTTDSYLQSDKVHLVRINNNTFGLVYDRHEQSFREYTRYVYCDIFSVSSNTITLLEREQQLYASASSSSMTSTRLGMSVAEITDNYILVVTPISYSSSFTGSSEFRVIVCNITSAGTLNVVKYYDFNVSTITTIRTLYLEILSAGFSLCKISQNKYIWCCRDTSGTYKQTYYFFLINVSSDYNTISINYVTNNTYDSTYSVILYLSKNLTDNNYCYVLINKNESNYSIAGTPVFSTIHYDVSNDTITLGTVVTPAIEWSKSNQFIWVAVKNIYGMFGSSYRAGTPETSIVYGHRIDSNGVLTFITVVKNGTETYGTAEIIPLIFNAQLNKTLLLQWRSSYATLYNVYLEPFNAVKRIKESESEIFGLTKTKCKTKEAGKVWVLNKTTEV